MTTSEARKLALGAIENASRVWASITARFRIGRPSNNWSATRSIDQISFGAAAPGHPARYRQARLCRGTLVRIVTPSSLYRRSMRFAFTGQLRERARRERHRAVQD